MPKLPRLPQQAEGSSAAAELLKVLLRLVAEREGVAAKVLASSDDLDRIAAEGEQADVPALSGWRRQVFGEEALRLVRGEIAIRFERRKIAVFEVVREREETADQRYDNPMTLLRSPSLGCRPISPPKGGDQPIARVFGGCPGPLHRRRRTRTTGET